MRIPLLVLGCLVGPVGCAAITTGTKQAIEVEPKSGDDTTIVQARCSLENDKGRWSLEAPGSIEVARSPQDLKVTCTAASGSGGSATAISRANAGMLGNVLLSCGVGLPIDHFTGAGYDYPSPIEVWLGRETRVDKREASPK